MNTEVNAADKKKETSRKARWLVLACVGLLMVNAGISYGIVWLKNPQVVSFDMKQTVDAFFDRAGQKKLSDEQTKALSHRFSDALEASLEAWQRDHHAIILVSPAVVQGAPDITREIQQEISRRMRDGS